MSGGAPEPRRGILEADEVWEGDVAVDGDVVVPAGRRLVLAPGCRVAFAASPRWSCAVFRSAAEGYPIEASRRELCDLVVLGRLEGAGTPEKPIVLGGGPWGGLLCLGSGRVALARAELAADGDAAVQVLDDGSVRLDACAISGAEVGIRALGLARVDAQGGTIRGGRCAVQAGEGAEISLRRTGILGSPEGFSLWHSATLDARGCRIAGARDRGVMARDTSWARLRGCEWIETPTRGERAHPARLQIEAEAPL